MSHRMISCWRGVFGLKFMSTEMRVGVLSALAGSQAELLSPGDTTLCNAAMDCNK